MDQQLVSPGGITPAASVTTTERLVFIKKVYSLLAMSMGSAAVGAYLGSGPLLLLVAPNMMLFFHPANRADLLCLLCCT